MKTQRVEETVPLVLQWKNQEGKMERLLTWEDVNAENQEIHIHLHLVQEGNNWRARLEEWSKESPKMLRCNTAYMVSANINSKW